MSTPSSSSSSLKGLVLVYTGDGKGKTTAALGLALRQIGWGRRVLIIQFMKGAGNVYGERIAAEKYLPLLEIEQHGRDEFVNLGEPAVVDKSLAHKALARAAEAFASGKYGMVCWTRSTWLWPVGWLRRPRCWDCLSKGHRNWTSSSPAGTVQRN
jgi:ATP:corrinoid adenosyltransferase